MCCSRVTRPRSTRPSWAWTNITASLAEDVAVLGVVAFAINNPEAAAAIAAVFLIIGLIGLYFIAKLVRRGWRKWKKKDPIAASI